MSDAVHHGHVDAIGDRVRPLDRAPGIVLSVAPFFFFRRMPPDRRRIEQHIRALQRCETRSFRIPLIPADQRSHFADVRIHSLESQIARSEIELLVIERIVGDMHLSINPNQRAVFLEDRRCVVINPGRSLFEEGSDQNDALLSCQLRETSTRGSRNRLRQIEERMVFALAEILGHEQLRQADDICTFAGSFAHHLHRVLEILLRIGPALHLHETYFV